MSTALANLSVEQLRRVLAIREQIEQLQAELARIAGAPAPAVRTPVAARKGRPARLAAAAPPVKRRRLSAVGRARIIAAAKARWAKYHASKKRAAAPAKGKGKAGTKRRKLSPEGRAAIIAAQKARWAKIRAAKAAQAATAG